MAKKQAEKCGCGCLHEYFGYGVLITFFGCIWLCQELGWLNIGVPMGPLLAIMIGLSLLLPHLKGK
ncbi:Uncharacterised protein [uncultured archaeon]|nr:Uncharacterised protein [uncultured archaeon]